MTGTHPITADKWFKAADTRTVGFFHSRLRELVADRLAESGKTWEEVVFDPDLELTRADIEKIEAELLATGYRYDVSARVSLEEAPEKYKPVSGITDSGTQEIDEAGRTLVGTGDNVFTVDADVVGTARSVNSVETVMTFLTDGVPDDTVAVIDDSGGTLTAPILEHFTAVVCLGGTVRSHLGILTREYNVPCLMAAQLDGLRDGDRLRVEYTAPAANAYADPDKATRARIWKLS